MSGSQLNNSAQMQVLSESPFLHEWLTSQGFSPNPFGEDTPRDFLVLGDDYPAYRAVIHQLHSTVPCALCLTQPFKGSYIETFQLGITHLIFINQPEAGPALALALQHAKNRRLDILRYSEYAEVPAIVKALDQTVETRHDLEMTMTRSREFLQGIGLTDDRLQNILLCQKEAVTNAVFHGFKIPGTTGNSKYDAHDFERLTDGDLVQIQLSCAPKWINLVVQDNSGKLGPLRVVNSLDRHHSSQGLLDTRGRGFFLMHQLADRAIVNIQRQVAIQVSLYFYQPAGPSDLHHFQLLIKD